MAFGVKRLLGTDIRFSDFDATPRSRVKPGQALCLALVRGATPYATSKALDRILLKHKLDRTNLKCPTLLIQGITDPGKIMKPFCDSLRGFGFTANVSSASRSNGPTLLGSKRQKTIFNKYFNKVGRPINLIGHSFGGLMSLHLARLHPEKVNAVIILASPCQLAYNEITANTAEDLGRLFKFIDRAKFFFERDTFQNWVGEQDRTPLGIPIISFVACKDEMVNPFKCEAPKGDLNRTVFVDCGHSDIKNHPAVIATIAHFYEHGYLAELPEDIVALGIVDRSNVVNPFVAQAVVYQPSHVSEGNALTLA